MAAYVISEVHVLDHALFAQYRALAKSSIDDHGGTMIVRAGTPVAAEGTWNEEWTLSITEFPDLETLNRWHDSPEYQHALTIRNSGAIERRMLFVNGR